MLIPIPLLLYFSEATVKASHNFPSYSNCRERRIKVALNLFSVKVWTIP